MCVAKDFFSGLWVSRPFDRWRRWEDVRAQSLKSSDGYVRLKVFIRGGAAGEVFLSFALRGIRVMAFTEYSEEVLSEV